jgi:prepilin-type N-terminal cleavage/methylation domain-containing protein
MSIEQDDGFTLVELLFSIAIMLSVTGAVFHLLHPARATFQAQPELADLQQRLRVAVDALTGDITMAGAGPGSGPWAGPVVSVVAPLLPYRVGGPAHDPAAGVFFRDDAITVVYVPGGAAHTILREPAISPGLLQLQTAANCPRPAADTVCGFAAGTRALLFDASGAWDALTVTDAAGQAVSFASDDPLQVAYGRGASLVEAVTATYYLKPGAGTAQLMRDDGDAPDVPVVDHVVGLRFEYFDDSQSPEPVAPATLTDGPWRPHPAARNRFDADLLAIRRVRVTMRVQVGALALRGSGALFRYPGRAGGAGGYVPDHEIRFDVAPRNLHLRWP